MLRLAFRFVGLLMLAVAFAALVVDGTRSVAAGAPAIMPLGRTTSALFPDLFVRFQTVVETHVPFLWDPIFVTVLLLPAWLVMGIGGFVLIGLTRRRAPKIGYSRR